MLVTDRQRLDLKFQLQSNPVKGDKFILEFSEIVPINGTLYNGNIRENNHLTLDFFEIVPFNGVPFNRVRLYNILSVQNFTAHCIKISIPLHWPFLLFDLFRALPVVSLTMIEVIASLLVSTNYPQNTDAPFESFHYANTARPVNSMLKSTLNFTAS